MSHVISRVDRRGQLSVSLRLAEERIAVQLTLICSIWLQLCSRHRTPFCMSGFFSGHLRLASGTCRCKVEKGSGGKRREALRVGSIIWCTDFALGDWMREHRKEITFGDFSFVFEHSSELCRKRFVHILMFLVHGFNVWCTDRDDFVTHISHKAAEIGVLMHR
jgi:hypothetical protein